MSSTCNDQPKATQRQQARPNRAFATAVSCMDGRVQTPLKEWLVRNRAVDYVDVITAPGIVRLLAEGDPAMTDSIRRSVIVSVARHNSHLVAVAGHHDCAGNPVLKKIHLGQIAAAVREIASWGLAVETIGLWVNRRWEVAIVAKQKNSEKGKP